VRKIALILFFILPAFLQVHAQTPCTTLGQNPSSAFPVCGVDTFSQSTVPYCGGNAVPSPCNVPGQFSVSDINPFWYKFTCYKAGTLGFLITPNDLNDDYDWQLFDITGHNANDIYTDNSLFIACNWSGFSGLTGATSAGTSLTNCINFDFPPFSSMPELKVNHNYILLISHFTQSQSGYTLSFGGGTTSITDPLVPDFIKVHATCGAEKIITGFNKKMKCGSIAPDGSDFSISPSVSTVIGATGVGCDNSFDADSVILTLSSPLPAGNYTITINTGKDGNTLLDNCRRNVMAGKNLPLLISPLQPTPMNSLTAVKCAPNSLELVFKKNIRCNSVALNGSDFVVTGPTPVTVIKAQGDCTNGLSDVIHVDLSAPVVTQGDYQLKLMRGSDGNTIIDECGQETPSGSTLSFATMDTVSASFTYTIVPGCTIDTVAFNHNGNNGVDQWLWKFDNQYTNGLKNPIMYFETSGFKQITLFVSNGTCSDTATNMISLGDKLRADFETNNLLCPEDSALFINKSTGNITGYYWDFGNGNESTAETPAPVKYPLLGTEKTYIVRLVIGNNIPCFDTAARPIKILKSCYIAVANAFTPNSDGVNDYLYPLNAYKADDLEFNIYNRRGQLVFHTNDWTKKWDGRIKGEPQDSGIYAWTLKFTHHDTGKKIFQKGTVALIR